MPALIRISCYEFLFKSQAQAAEVIRCLCGAVQVESDFDESTCEKFFYPAKRLIHVEMHIVSDRQLRHEKPGLEKLALPAPSAPVEIVIPARPSRRRVNGQRQFLLGEGDR